MAVFSQCSMVPNHRDMRSGHEGAVSPNHLRRSGMCGLVTRVSVREVTEKQKLDSCSLK